MNRYLITYESAHWCGAADTCVVYADSENDALDRASAYMEESMRERFSGEYDEESNYDDESAYSINSIELFDKNHEEWGYFMDKTQSQFYPEVN